MKNQKIKEIARMNRVRPVAVSRLVFRPFPPPPEEGAPLRDVMVQEWRNNPRYRLFVEAASLLNQLGITLRLHGKTVSWMEAQGVTTIAELVTRYNGDDARLRESLTESL